MAITLDELKARLPDALKPWADQYGAAVLSMAADEVVAWINRLAQGDITGAYRAIIAKMPNAGLLGQWDQLNADWQAENVKNADRITLMTAAVAVVVKVVLTMLLAAAGF
jgi:hypothetical protein